MNGEDAMESRIVKLYAAAVSYTHLDVYKRQDIHTNLVTIPLETGYTMPYGLMYANAPTPAAKKFIEAAGRLSGMQYQHAR